MNCLPRVTVLMPVFNGEEFLQEAVESILCQTFPDFELLIINDGSTDGSREILIRLSDPRIRLIHNERNMGLIATLNHGMGLARGEYIARMDCDDVSRPERLAKQVDFLDQNPEVGICGAWFRKFGPGTNKVVRWETEPVAVRASMLFSCTLPHPTVMLRKALFAAHDLLYDAAYPHAEDYDLWSRALNFMQAANLPEVLLDYRVHPHQVTQRLSEAQVETAGRVRLRQLRESGFAPTPEEFRVHQAVSTCIPMGIENIFNKTDNWLCALKRRNDEQKTYAEPAFSRVLLERWITFVKKCWSQTGVSRQGSLCFPHILKETGMDWVTVLNILLRLRG